MSVVVQSVEDMAAMAAELLEELPRNLERATIVALSGDVGAGKTTYVQAVAKALGVRERVTSPTFVIERVYEIPGGKRFKRLVHIDAYRLLGPQELDALGWRERVADPANLIFLEWPEKVAECVPPHAHKLTLTYIDEQRRRLHYD